MARASEIPPPVAPDGDHGGLRYVRDERGNQLPDFSHAGYRGGGVPLPDAPVRVIVAPAEGDDGARIQVALDHVAQLAPDANGLRGAVLLAPGRFEISGSLHLNASGVVLRGSGADENGTLLVATGVGRRTLIEIAGRADRTTETARAVVDDYVPVGATRLQLADATGLRVGDRVVVERPSTQAWIKSVGMDDAPSRPALVWKPGSLNIRWDRTITAISGNEITLDAPITTALEKKFGGGTVARYSWPGRVSDVGVENFRCESAWDASNPVDEEHAWMAISIDAAENVWVRDVTGAHFVSSLVDVRERASRVTVQDCASLAPVSELVGYRRHTFHTAGQLTLFLRCRAEEGLHDFVAGYLAAGPNVFLECEARDAHGFSGSIGSWASGLLFDNVTIDGASLDLTNLENWNQDVGWAAANSILWQSSAFEMEVRMPPGAQNWVVAPWSKYRGDAHWSLLNDFVKPDSLYRGQLAARLGEDSLAALDKKTPRIDIAGTNARELALEKVVPDLAAKLRPPPPVAGKKLEAANGWLVADGRLLTGSQIDVPTWNGHLLTERAPERGPALTRFVPGRVGPGLTDDLAELADTMIANNQVALRHHWGLWYDQRRDDHQMIRRGNGDVWPPFFEQPWARTGRGTTWNGISLYDLTRYNPWYFSRLREFAGIARERGLVLVNEMYFQHNILEAGAHWADFPWRPANAIQDTGFPEPPTYVGKKRQFMAEIFYDLSHPVRRQLHRAYIRQCLANLADEPNVIHTTGDEFTGPLTFVQFWLDVVAEWEKETGRHPLIAISATKDVQDAILADPKRAPLISVIDLKYWWRTDRELYAPPGGENLSPRQQERLWKGGRPTAASIARMVRAYREKFPDKAVITALPEADGWAFVAAGGSLAKLPKTTDARLRAALATMQPLVLDGDAADATRQWQLAEKGKGVFVVSLDGESSSVDLRGESGSFHVHRIDPETGSILAGDETIAAGKVVSLEPSSASGKTTVVWLSR